MKVCGAKKVVSTLTNSVNVTSGPPCLAVIKRKDASVTPSIGERPMMGFSIFCQKFILPVNQNTTTKHASKWDRELYLRQKWDLRRDFAPGPIPQWGHFFWSCYFCPRDRMPLRTRRDPDKSVLSRPFRGTGPFRFDTSVCSRLGLNCDNDGYGSDESSLKIRC